MACIWWRQFGLNIYNYLYCKITEFANPFHGFCLNEYPKSNLMCPKKYSLRGMPNFLRECLEKSWINRSNYSPVWLSVNRFNFRVIDGIPLVFRNQYEASEMSNSTLVWNTTYLEFPCFFPIVIGKRASL